LVSRLNLLQSFNYTPFLFHKKRFKSEIIPVYGPSMTTYEKHKQSRRLLSEQLNVEREWALQRKSDRTIEYMWGSTCIAILQDVGLCKLTAIMNIHDPLLGDVKRLLSTMRKSRCSWHEYISHYSPYIFPLQM
jgi:hypothetical protein